MFKYPTFDEYKSLYPNIPSLPSLALTSSWHGSGVGYQSDESSWKSNDGSSGHDVKEPQFSNQKIQHSQMTVLGQNATNISSSGQDFYELRDQCLQSGRLFEDFQFPPTDSSIYFSKRCGWDVQWKRPFEICPDPKLFVDGFSRFDVQQGELGDCWLLAAIANLTLYRNLFFQIVPEDQDFAENYAGIFHFRFWQFGKWVEVVIDDKLPTINGKLMFMNSPEENEFWSALLEKAYAKLHGSYEALKGGSTCEAMEDFTGGVSEMYEMDSFPPDLFKILLKCNERFSLMGCSIEPDPNEFEAETPQGLIRGHAYSITNVCYMDIQTPNTSGRIPMIRLRNPWGNESEWNGPFSDKSPEWQFISEHDKERVGLVFDHDGEFWMTFKDFQNYFTRIEICNLGPEYAPKMRDGHTIKQWELSSFEGHWLANRTAGGCRNYLSTFANNPQFFITLDKADEGDEENKCTLIIALMQKNRRGSHQNGVDFLSIGFAIYRISNSESFSKPLGMNFFRFNSSIGRSPAFINLREVSCRFRLPCGTYCILPSTFEPNEEAEFLLRVFTENEISSESVVPTGGFASQPKNNINFFSLFS